ncbi:MarR family winged helix-turn-helix transcriptional regulator [Anaerofustis stercorihominis]|uniref:MarR family winged helix-turn-helix transcriptional regulator n=1 Tax=Anaerofustis stercorihominis TaxID=214853 RepID=UPI00214AC825|nr:MarR family transcriptional regulator [Anaerofustis stercorihominis]MCR2033378.1 MarR family transcriptional regulator [Anaerofustis stercorihominis]
MKEDNETLKKELKEFVYYLHSINKIFTPKMDCHLILPKSEFFLLSVLLREKKENDVDGIYPSEISLKSRLSRPAITQTLNSLEKKGYIIRVLEENDRRKFKVSITEDGKKIVDDAFEDRFLQLMEIANKLGEEKLKQLLDILKEIVEIYKN